MPISSLPDSTLRAITSTLVLNDAVSVVKELVDNALDAKATTIAIEISANTLDVIQVKDNGTGIGVEDRQLVCKRGCTSKITTITDLEQLGGSSLGFRGEALASIADLSESVTLTTRVDGETAGSMLKYGPAGALLSCSSASHPVGSSVRVKDFLKSIPVRKQTAVKNASKTLFTIKKLLESYVFARGTVRLSFKVLKGKNDKVNWSYSPVESRDRLGDIATRVIGKDATSHCEVMTKKVLPNGENDAEDDGYSLIALLAIIDEDAAKLHNVGHYISIDGRPVTAARGTAKKIVKLYQKYVRNHGATVTKLPVSFDPLLVIHFTCPLGSYDVNVEPAKDEVMFINPDPVLVLVEHLFRGYYGELPQPGKLSTQKDMPSTSRAVNHSFDLLLAKRPVPLEEPSESCHQVIPAEHPEKFSKSHIPPLGQREVSRLSDVDSRIPITCPIHKETVQAVEAKVHSNMYGFDEDELEISPPSSGSGDADHDIGDVGDEVARNPWSLAKLNGPIRRGGKTDVITPSAREQNTSAAPVEHGNACPPSTPQSSTHCQPSGLRAQLPSPLTSPYSLDVFQNPGPPQRPWPSRQRRERAPDTEIEPQTMFTTPSTQDQESVAKPLDSWAKPVLPRTEVPSFKPVSVMHGKGSQFSEKGDSDSLEPLTPGGQSSCVQTSLRKVNYGHLAQGGLLGRPFRSPLISRPADAATNGATSSPAAQLVEPGSQQPLLKLSQSQNLELDQIMEFEHRKKAANAQQRKAFGKATALGISVAKLAHLQRSSSQVSDDETVSNIIPDIENHAKDLISQGSAFASFGDRFKEPDAGPKAASKPSPHRNRYLAAARNLTRSQSDHDDINIDIPGSLRDFTEVTGDEHEIPHMPEDDARAYLVRHRNQTDNANAGGMTRPGLKIRRTKTQRLPLESIPPDVLLHEVITTLDFDVRAYDEAAFRDDSYSTTGKNEVIVWTSNMSDVAVWQKELTTLLEERYRARVGDDLLPSNIKVDLKRMIKMHCDNM